MDEGQGLLRAERLGEGIGVVIAVAFEDHLGPEVAGVLDLHHGRASRHDDGGGHAQPRPVIGEALGVIAGTGGDDPVAALGVIQLQELVQGPALLEGGGELQVLELHPHLGTGDLGQGPGVAHGGAFDLALQAACGGDDVVEAEVGLAGLGAGGHLGLGRGHGRKVSQERVAMGARIMGSPERPGLSRPVMNALRGEEFARRPRPPPSAHTPPSARPGRGSWGLRRRGSTSWLLFAAKPG